MVENKWIDIIVYLDNDGETIRYIVSDIGNEQIISYGGISVFEQWMGREYNVELNIPFEYWENDVGIEAPISHVEFIKYGNGSLKGYMNDNIPAYQHNQNEVNEFLDREIEFIPEQQFNKHEF